MKTKILIGLMLCFAVVLSGCGNSTYKNCFGLVAEDFCKTRDCEVKKVNVWDNNFIILTGEFRETKYIEFTKKENERCDKLREEFKDND